MRLPSTARAVAAILALVAVGRADASSIAGGGRTAPAAIGPAQAVWLVRLAPGAPESTFEPSSPATRMDAPGAPPQASDGLDRVAAWQAHRRAAEATLAGLAPLVEDLAEGGHITATELLPAARVLAVWGDRVARDRLAGAAPVLGVQANRRHRLPAAPDAVPGVGARAGHLERVNAPEAWRLGATGNGAVVGIMDSGVDWRHPALSGRYRGRDGRHDYGWADLAEDGRGSREPVDPNGHGTHVAGLAVGHGTDGAWGVAPGAQWLAVRVFDGQGETSDLTLLRGAEWLLAPTDRDGQNARPQLAPDVVNASWNLENGADPLFEPILAAWREAGIVAVFAAGNDEDASGSFATVRAPGSSALALSVGAMDAQSGIWPLSRGGPTWDGRLKPDLVAPGVGLVSSVPGGGFAPRTGTSMATPLVAGTAALLRGAVPWLSPEDVGEALRSAAGDLGLVGPDPVFGHGQLNAGAAVRRALSSGRVGGRVVAENGVPIANAGVAATRAPGDEIRGRAVGDGTYSMLLPAGAWTLRFEAPGREPLVKPITVSVAALTIADAQMVKPSGGAVVGTLRGRDGRPLVGTVAAVHPAPVGVRAGPGTSSDANGRYVLALATGRHVVRFSAAGHRAVTETIAVNGDRVEALDATLRRAPPMLLVDADAWQGERVWPYIGRALADAGYAYDVWTIDDPRARAPAFEDLAPYGVVWWAHLFGSPGQLDRRRGDLRVTGGLAAYAAAGGRLIVSGQDIGAWDAEDGFISGRFAPAFYRDVLGARLVAERATGTSVLGSRAPLDGLQLSLDHPLARHKGPRLAPDAVAAARADSNGLMTYEEGAVAALGSTGDRGRRAYLAFGPESTGGRSALARLVDGAIGWLEAPEVALTGLASAAPGDEVDLALSMWAGRGGGAAEVRLTVPEDLLLAVPEGWQGTADGASWQGELAPDGHYAWPLAVRVAPDAVGRTLAVDVATAVDALLQGQTHELSIAAPDLRRSTLDLSPASPIPGEEVRAALVVRNDGPVAGTAIARLGVPPGWQPSTPPVTATHGTAAWRLGAAEWRGTIAPGDAVTLTVAGRMSGAVGEAMVLRAAITPTAGAPLWRDVATVLGAPRLTFAAPPRVPSEISAGSAFTAAVPVSNAGLMEAVARVTLSLPEGMFAIDAPAPGGVVTWSVPIAAGVVATPTVQVRVDPRASAGLRNLIASAEDAGSTGAAQIARAVIRVHAPDLSPSTVRFAPAVPRGGQPLTITLRLVNAGTVATEVRAIDALAPSLTVADGAVVVTGGAIERSPGLVEWLVDVPPGAVETLTMRARVGSTLGPNARVPHAWRLSSPAGVRVMSDTLLADPLALSGSTLARVLGSSRPGGRARFRLTLAADGVVDARDGTARIDLPWAMSLVAASQGLVVEDPRTLAWRGRLAPGERRPLEFDVRLDDGVAAGVVLPVSARVAAAGVAPIRIVDGAAVAVPGVTIGMTATNAMPMPGETVRVVVSLHQAAPAGPVALHVHVPLGLSFVAGSGSVTAGRAPEWLPIDRRVSWSGSLLEGAQFMMSFSARSSVAPGGVATIIADVVEAGGRRLDGGWVDVIGGAARAWLPRGDR